VVIVMRWVSANVFVECVACGARALLLAAAVLALAAPAWAAGYDLESVKRRAAELIEKQIDAERVPGLSIALVDDQQVVWAAGFGYADTSARSAARADTLYSIGTLTMPLTAAAVMQLVDRGLVDLDQPVERYLPEFSIRHRFASAPTITPRQLLTHHSGLPAMRFRGMWTREPEPLAAVLRHLRADYLTYVPGEVFSQSHLGYDVLGRLIEVVSGKPFDTYMREELLLPLGMHESSFRRDGLDATRLAKGYWRGRTETDVLAVRDTPAAGLYSSVGDLARFAQVMFADGRRDGSVVLSARAVREMLRTQNDNVALDLDTRVGLGWRLNGIRLERTGRVVWQHGSSPIGRGRMLLAPDQQLGVVVLANSSGGAGAIEKVSEKVLEMLLEAQPLSPPGPREHVAVPAGEPTAPREITGHYASMAGLVTVTASEERLRAAMLGKSFALEAREDGLYDIGYRLLGVLPLPVSALKEVRVQPARLGERQLVVVRYKDHVMRFAQRFEPAALTETWRRRLGEYEATERDALLDLIEIRSLRLEYEDGVLAFRYRVPGWLGLVARIPVRPVSDTELVIEGTGWLMGETIRVVKHGDEERLLYSGYELRRAGS
jgi:CubicO group peptidase (beta-lactamase class C family)